MFVILMILMSSFDLIFSQTSVKRMGRWIDFKNDYKTLYPWFMETVWYDEDDLWVERVFPETASDAEASSQFVKCGHWQLYSHHQKNTTATMLPLTLAVSFPVHDYFFIFSTIFWFWFCSANVCVSQNMQKGDSAVNSATGRAVYCVIDGKINWFRIVSRLWGKSYV